jgi:putative ABC transport system ATP-binding protein
VISLRNVTKAYDHAGHRVLAVNGVDLDVERGQFVSLMGPSGSGKSSLLHLMAGLDSPTSGEVRIGDHLLSEMTDDALTLFRRRSVGFVFQFFNLLPTLSAEENVALPLLLDGNRMRTVRERAVHLLELVGMAHRRTHRPDQLSGGEQQRVAVARALVFEPLVLLADEPTGNLDTKRGQEILDLIRRLGERRGQTIVLVTHDPRAAACGDVVITIKDGRIANRTPTTRGVTGPRTDRPALSAALDRERAPLAAPVEPLAGERHHEEREIGERYPGREGLELPDVQPRGT